MNNRFSTKKIGIMAIFVSLGLVLQYAESRFLITPIPGGKLGLTNVVSIINIFMLGGRNAIVVAVIRAFLGALLTGGAAAVPYSVAGAMLAVLAMTVMKKILHPRVSMVGISIVGAVFHNLAQLTVASLVYKTFYVYSYLPLLLLLSLAMGTVTGCVTQIFSERILKSKKGIN